VQRPLWALHARQRRLSCPPRRRQSVVPSCSRPREVAGAACVRRQLSEPSLPPGLQPRRTWLRRPSGSTLRSGGRASARCGRPSRARARARRSRQSRRARRGSPRRGGASGNRSARAARSCAACSARARGSRGPCCRPCCAGGSQTAPWHACVCGMRRAAERVRGKACRVTRFFQKTFLKGETNKRDPNPPDSCFLLSRIGRKWRRTASTRTSSLASSACSAWRRASHAPHGRAHVERDAGARGALSPRRGRTHAPLFASPPLQDGQAHQDGRPYRRHARPRRGNRCAAGETEGRSWPPRRTVSSAGNAQRRAHKPSARSPSIPFPRPCSQEPRPRGPALRRDLGPRARDGGRPRRKCASAPSVLQGGNGGRTFLRNLRLSRRQSKW
jgi:hypothetical protein